MERAYAVGCEYFCGAREGVVGADVSVRVASREGVERVCGGGGDGCVPVWPPEESSPLRTKMDLGWSMQFLKRSSVQETTCESVGLACME